MAGLRALRTDDPRQVGLYRLLGLLGEGGQGTVYQGLAPGGEPVAVKLLHARFAGDDRARARFAAELDHARRVAAFCTARVLDADVAGDRPYIVSEFVAGPSLGEVIASGGPVTGGALERLAIATVTALAAIHEAGVVHRDFKPGNVIMGADGPRVIDFGIARALDATGTMSSAVVGTPAYMAPEQIAGQAVGPAADVFAWACTIAHAATGATPFGQDSIPAVMHRILHADPDLGPLTGALTGPLREILTACLAKDPARRPAARQILLSLLGAGHPADTLLAEGARAAAHPAAHPGPGAGPPPYDGPRPSDAPPPRTLPLSSAPSAADGPRPGARVLGASPMIVAAVLALGGFMVLLDGTVMGTAVRTLSMDFGASYADAQWVITAYLLAATMVIPVTGWLAQRFGAAAVWITALVLSLAGSVLCGLAWSFGALIAFRVIQGLGAGMVFPLSRILVAEVAGRERRGRAMALIAVAVQAAPIAGPVVAGVVIDMLSWRWIFFLTVPLLLLTSILSAVLIPFAPDPAVVGRPDVGGLICLSGGLTAVVFGLSRMGGNVASVVTPEVALPLTAGVGLLAAYVGWAARSTGRVVDPRLFRDRAFAASASASLLHHVALFAAVFLVPLYFQTVDGLSARQAGWLFAAQGAGTLVAVLLAGWLVDVSRNARLPVLVGLALVAAGTLPFALASAHTNPPVLVAALFVRGVGLAFVGTPLMTSLYHSLPEARIPAATTANAMGLQAGGAAGTALIAVVLGWSTVPGVASLSSGFPSAFWAILVVVALTVVPALLLPAGEARRTST
ncbi:DHA2 family efflux MFS transporter permease subunit [Microbispora catharanthi]|uniref:DHA2 family efflux MFS transporter permease subunit n=1 Tax=Microbispora catharanthi TaxID=1712871 RepID=A0A5N6BX75_9ACTN|nr:DHA2 family efflux MFS transporter permease subunit [Microbispora catharanthi]KAB8185079.1 DHA2 family efflux MFS transporter permease subunit [Microbispora catharanthi]